MSVSIEGNDTRGNRVQSGKSKTDEVSRAGRVLSRLARKD
jgi:hypothetical protein